MTHDEQTQGWTSASNSTADALCQGRHQAQAGLPDIATEDASFGVDIHTALATGDSSKLTNEQLSIYEGCQQIVEKLILEKFGINAPNVERIKEQRFWWRSEDGKLTHSGQVDLLMKFGDEALIVDYKCLPGEQSEAAKNEQLRDLAALAAGNLKLTEVDVAIVQPLVTYSPEACRYDTVAIAQSQVDMMTRVAASNAPGAKRTAGKVQCAFCKARHTCPERAAFMTLVVPPAMSGLTLSISQWTPAQRTLFCTNLPIAIKWLEECKTQIKAMLAKDPDSVPGFKLAEGNIKRPINDPNELHTRFLAAGGTTEAFLLCVTIAKGSLEDQVRAATQLKGKALKAKIDELLAGITDEKKDAPSLEEIKPLTN